MIAEGTDAANVTAEQIAAVAGDVELFCKKHKISRKDVARAIGYSAGVVSEFLAGKYAGSAGQVALDLENWLVEEEQRRSRDSTTQFVWTNVALEMKGVANYCLDYRKIGMIYGPDTSGLGKTTALTAIQQELGPRRCSLVTIDKTDASPAGVLRKICAAIGRDSSGPNHQLFRRIVEHLEGRSHLLMVDQAHSLRGAKDDKPFYLLADLYDRAKTAQLWVGTADLVNYLQRQQTRNADESLAQIRRRIFPCVDLMECMRNGGDGGGNLLVTVEQVREMFARNKLKLTNAAARFLCELCNEPDSGSIGLCVQLVEYATVLAEQRRLPSIDVPLLQEAMRRGMTSSRCQRVMHQVEETRARIAKVG